MRGLVLGFVLAGCSGGPCALNLALSNPANYDLDGDGVRCDQGDCVDLDPAIHPSAPEFCDGYDNDCDGHLLTTPNNPAVPWEADFDGDGSLSCEQPADCDDHDATVHPGAPEICDGADNDCQGPLDPAESTDDDADGFLLCLDCDDLDPAVHPGLSEACNGIDDDCSGAADVDGVGHLAAVELDPALWNASFAGNLWLFEQDVVLTGFGQRITGVPFASPQSPPLQAELVIIRLGDFVEAPTMVGAWPMTPPLAESWWWLIEPEIGDWWRAEGVATALPAGAYLIATHVLGPDPATFVAEDLGPTDPWQFWEGATFLSLGMDEVPVAFPPPHFATLGLQGLAFAQAITFTNSTEGDRDQDGTISCLDCDEAVGVVDPWGAAEWCDGLDNDCLGGVSTGELDPDVDGFVDCAEDCAPTDPDAWPLADEVCDGVDNNCLDGLPAEDEGDADGDGWLICDGDCNDSDPAAHPGAAEACDSIDQDCDGNRWDFQVDSDGDGVWNCLDCGPFNAAVYPGAADTCGDGWDQNCDGLPESGGDQDGDGYSTCQGDCDDGLFIVHPGAVDVAGNSLDEDCDGAVDGLAEGVRLIWGSQGTAIEAVEGLWAPIEGRGPAVGGDYVAYTTRADGTVVDMERLDVYPRVHLAEGAGPPGLGSSFRSENPMLGGSLWLRAHQAAQVHLARTNPWQVLETRVVPTPPPSNSFVAAFTSPAPSSCDALLLLATPEDALDEMGSPAFWPWIEFNANEAWYEWLWAVQYRAVSTDTNALLNEADGALKLPPSVAEVAEICRGLAGLEPRVVQAISSVDWGQFQPFNAWGVSGGTEIGNHIVFDYDVVFTPLLGAHEGAHPFLNEIEFDDPAWAYSPDIPAEVLDWFLDLAALGGASPINLEGILEAITASATNVVPRYEPGTCTGGTQSWSYVGDGFGALSGSPFSCAFFPTAFRSLEDRWYGARSPHEDLAEWIGGWAVANLIVPDSHPTPDPPCPAGINVAPGLLSPGQLPLHLKLQLLHQLGAMPAWVFEQCLDESLPSWWADCGFAWSEQLLGNGGAFSEMITTSTTGVDPAGRPTLYITSDSPTAGLAQLIFRPMNDNASGLYDLAEDDPSLPLPNVTRLNEFLYSPPPGLPGLEYPSECRWDDGATYGAAWDGVAGILDLGLWQRVMLRIDSVVCQSYAPNVTPSGIATEVGYLDEPMWYLSANSPGECTAP